MVKLEESLPYFNRIISCQKTSSLLLSAGGVIQSKDRPTFQACNVSG